MPSEDDRKETLLGALTAKEWLTYAEGGASTSYGAGEEIFTEKAEAPYYALILSGKMTVLHEWPDGTREPLGSLGAGDGFWTDLGLGSRGSRFIFTADGKVRLIPLSEAGYDRLVRERPEIGRLLNRLLARRIRGIGIIVERQRIRRAARERARHELDAYRDTYLVINARTTGEIPEEFRSLAGEAGPVLIEGEYGTGKQLLAWKLHQEAGKKPDTFLTVDCEQLTEENWRNEWFGDEGISIGTFDLAEGGTVFFRSCELMPPGSQWALRQMMEEGGFRRDGALQPLAFRVVASTRSSLREAVEQGHFDGKLHDLLAGRTIRMPPLRERKKDIPALAEYYMKRYAALRGKKITEVAPEAMKLLLNHDYRLANIRELEQAMERAVTLTKDDRIWAHHIFLGAPATETDHSYVNLLAWPRFRRMVLENRYPRLGQNITAAIFVTLITLCLFGPQDPVGNPALAVVWGIWWPLMFFSFVWIGRSWCSICAYATFARFAKRLRSPEIKLPGWVREYDAFLMAGGFLLVLWIEEVTGLRTSPRGTGFLMLSMFSLAIVAAYLFRRESWCRYLCPLGGMIGVCSMCSILEVRPNADVCINQCQTHDCYQGTPAVPGCPTFEHLAFVDNNQTCKLCLNCTRSCPHDAVMVNFRIPGREIWMMNKVRDRMSAFVCVLLGAALPALWLQAFKIQPAAAGMVGAYTAAQIGFPILAALALWAPNLLAPAGEEGTGWKRFWMTGYAYVPLAVAAHLSYRLRHVMGDNPTWLVLQTPKGVEVTATLVQPFQLTAVLLGGIYSIFCLWRVRHRREGRDFEASPAYWRAHGLVLAGYGAMVTALILAGE